jgi:hypothetical protein
VSSGGPPPTSPSTPSSPIAHSRDGSIAVVNPSSHRLTSSDRHTMSSQEDLLEKEMQSALQPPQRISQVLLDDNLMEFTRGRPFPLKHRAKVFYSVLSSLVVVLIVMSFVFVSLVVFS